MWTLEAAAGCNQDLKQASPAVDLRLQLSALNTAEQQGLHSALTPEQHRSRARQLKSDYQACDAVAAMAATAKQQSSRAK
jgi:hypothetical protein